MRLNWFFGEYFAAIRTCFHFAILCVLLAIFSLPLQLLGLLNDGRYPVLTGVIQVVCLLVYLPFCILWASRVSGVRPPTEEETDLQYREAVRRKNVELNRETHSA